MKITLLFLFLSISGYAQVKKQDTRVISKQTFVQEYEGLAVFYTKDVDVFNSVIEKFQCLTAAKVKTSKFPGDNNLYQLRFKYADGRRVESFIKRNFK